MFGIINYFVGTKILMNFVAISIYDNLKENRRCLDGKVYQ